MLSSTVAQLCRSTLLLLPVLLLSASLRAENSESSSTVIRTTDPAGNLSGDAKRTFLDLVQIELKPHFRGRTLILTLAGPLPDPASLLGTGLRFIIEFWDTPCDSHATPALHHLDLWLTPSHWDWNLKSAESDMVDLVNAVSLESDSQIIRLHLPEALFTDISCLSVSATTEDYPKWLPVTTHPAVHLRLQSTPPSPR